MKPTLFALVVLCGLIALPFARANPDSPGVLLVAQSDPEAVTVDATIYGDGSGFGAAAVTVSDSVPGSLAAPERSPAGARLLSPEDYRQLEGP
jgi:hypothetical protein